MAEGKGKNAIIVVLVAILFLIMATEMFYLVKQNRNLKTQLQRLSHREAGTIPVGSVAPDFSLAMLSGRKVSLSDYHGKNLILIFFSTECPGCLVDLPNWKKLIALESDTLKALGIVDSEPEKIKRFLEAYSLDLEVAMDPKGAVKEAYKCEGVPQKALITRSGKIGFVETGAIPIEEEGRLEQKLLSP